MNEEKTPSFFFIKDPELIKFAIIGASGILVNLLVLNIAYELFMLGEDISVILGIIISMTSNYIFNRKWTFHSSNPLVAEYFQYVLSNSLGALVQFIITKLGIRIFHSLEIYEINMLIKIDVINIAALVGILIAFAINFILSKYFVFNKKQK